MKVKLPFSPFYIYYFGLLLMAVGMPVSIFLMSISFVFMAIGWLLTGNFIERLRSFFSNKIALIISSIFILHLIGLIYTTDMSFGMNDVKIKLPLLLLPFLVSTMPKLNALLFRWLLFIFCAAVFTGTIIGCFILMGFGKTNLMDVRQLSPFISHIRFSLMICLSVFILVYYFIKDAPIKIKAIYSLLIIWFIVYLFILESLTGLVILFLLSGILLSYYIFTRKNMFLKFGYILCIAAVCFFLYFIVQRQLTDLYVLNDKADLRHLDSLTAHGNPYEHDLKNNNLENGYYTGIYLCWKELETTWDQRSKFKFLERDQKGNYLRFTVQRYLTSKGLRKDAEGVNALDPDDIKNIEMGIPDCRYVNMSQLEARINATLWEFSDYAKGRDPSGHSAAQRLEFWKAAIAIIKDHPIAGVGTGDGNLAFKEEYDRNGTQLSEKYRLRSHNQFLAIAVAFGTLGLLWFLFTLFFPLTLKLNRNDLLYMCFFLIAIFSMVNEDTLETQAGVTFFAFFNSIFLLGREKEI